jgi:hypothetical protein
MTRSLAAPFLHLPLPPVARAASLSSGRPDGPVDGPVRTTAAPLAALDHVLLAAYDPSRSFAWPGAAPERFASAVDANQLSFDYDTPVITDDETFSARGFRVERLLGAGLRSLILPLFRRYHYTGSAGMQGPTFGLRAPSGALVGVARFARAANAATAAGMIRPSPEDLTRVARGEWTALDLAHHSVREYEYADLTRLVLMPSGDAGVNLGTGAETFFVAGCLRLIQLRNRALWRAVRKRELGFPINVEEQALLDALPCDADSRTGMGFWKVIRTFADAGQQHRGVIYQALGMHACGQTPARRATVGLRSGLPRSERSAQKSRGREKGHDAQVLRAGWEGADIGITVSDAVGRVVHEESGAWIRRVSAPDMTDELQGALLRAWRVRRQEIATRLRHPVTALTFTTADRGGGYAAVVAPGKYRYAAFLGSSYFQSALADRCTHLAERRASERLRWRTPERRWGRGIGFNWPAQPDVRHHYYPRTLASSDTES